MSGSSDPNIRLRLRGLVLGFGDKDLADQNEALALQLVSQITNSKDLSSCMQEILGSWEDCNPTVRRLRARVAATAVGVQDNFTVGIVSTVIKAMLAILAVEKNDATLTEMTALMQITAKAALTAPPEELAAVEESTEPFLYRRMIVPLIKAGVSGAGKDRAPAACTLVSGVLQACAGCNTTPEALNTCSEFLKYVLQLQNTGNLPVTVVEAYAPIRHALEALGSGLSSHIVRRVTSVCTQGLKSKESWPTRKQAALTVATLTAVAVSYETTPQGTKRLKHTSALTELVGHKGALMSTLDAVKYDKIAQVREAVGKALGELATLPDEMQSEDPDSYAPSPAASPLAATAAVLEDEKKRPRSRSFSKALGLNKLKGAFSREGSRSPSEAENEGSNNSPAVHKQPSAPDGVGNSPKVVQTSRLAREGSKEMVVEKGSGGGGGSRDGTPPTEEQDGTKSSTRKSSGRQPLSRFRSPANNNGGNFDVAVEVYAPPSPPKQQAPINPDTQHTPPTMQQHPSIIPPGMLFPPEMASPQQMMGGMPIPGTTPPNPAAPNMVYAGISPLMLQQIQQQAYLQGMLASQMGAAGMVPGAMGMMPGGMGGMMAGPFMGGGYAAPMMVSPQMHDPTSMGGGPGHVRHGSGGVWTYAPVFVPSPGATSPHMGPMAGPVVSAALSPQQQVEQPPSASADTVWGNPLYKLGKLNTRGSPAAGARTNQDGAMQGGGGQGGAKSNMGPAAVRVLDMNTPDTPHDDDVQGENQGDNNDVDHEVSYEDELADALTNAVDLSSPDTAAYPNRSLSDLQGVMHDAQSGVGVMEKGTIGGNVISLTASAVGVNVDHMAAADHVATE